MPSHSKQNPSAYNKTNSVTVTKVKQKSKRRYRKKKKQRIQYPIHEIRKLSNRTSTTRFNNGNDGSSTSRNYSMNQMAVAQMWAKSYESMIRLQFQHRIQYWKNLAINRSTEVEGLRKKLQSNCEYYDGNESSDDSTESTSQEDVESESYLKFLEITLRHRQQRIRENRDEDSD